VRLHRLATLSLEKIPHENGQLTLRWGEVSVEVSRTTRNGIEDERLFAIASLNVPSIAAIDSDGFVIPPKHARETCERAIAFIANILAVFSRGPKRIASASPCICLL